MADIEKYISNINKMLELDNQKREELITLGRSAIRCSSIAIRHLHRKEISNAENKIQENKKLISQINELAKELNPLRFGMILSANQEYVEAVFLYSFIQGESFPSHDDLNVPYLAYLHGIPDFAGELRRVILDTLRKKDSIGLAVKALDLMDELYSLLVTIDYPDGLTYNLRKKTDFTRSLLERTRGDVTLALNRLDLVTTLDKTLKAYLPSTKNDKSD